MNRETETSAAESPRPLISFCITTFNRGEIVRETLECLLEQAGDDIEVVVVDPGTDGSCRRIVAELAARYEALRYFPQEENCGLDRDFCHAVELATGKYCWMFSDDDKIRPGAVARIRQMLVDEPSLIVTNAAVHGPNLKRQLDPAMMKLTGNRTLSSHQQGELLALAGQCLSFIGCVIIRRSVWLSRDPRPYWGTMFVHVGMIFQSPLPGSAVLLAEPEVIIRYGVGTWRPRQFEIWTKLWPELIWSFDHLPEADRAAVVDRYPGRHLPSLLMYRAKNAYDLNGFRRIVAGTISAALPRLAAMIIAALPPAVLRSLAVMYIRLARPQATLDLVDLAAAGGRLTQFLAGLPGQPK